MTRTLAKDGNQFWGWSQEGDLLTWAYGKEPVKASVEEVLKAVVEHRSWTAQEFFEEFAAVRRQSLDQLLRDLGIISAERAGTYLVRFGETFLGYYCGSIIEFNNEEEARDWAK
jgi:hypothetical protein